MSFSPSLEGTLHVLPFGGGSLAARVREIYAEALAAVGGDPRDVLVLKRLPHEVPEFTAALRDEVGLQARPNVQSVARHASTVVAEARPETTRLSYEQRIEFLATVLDGHSWGPYFADAEQHDSFGSDVGQLLLDATWQGGFDTDRIGDGEYDSYLQELADVNQAFHEKLAERDLVEQAQTVPLGIEALDSPGVRQQVECEFDLVLALEFEEYSAVERAYLGSLTETTDLVCVAERDASIDRTKKEVGSVESVADGLEIIDHGESGNDTDPTADHATTTDHAEATIPQIGASMAGQPFASFLATGSVPEEAEATARLIEADTLDRQLQAVANEIAYLRETEGWAYDEFAVLLRSVGDPMPRVRRLLQTAGIPTASAGVNGLEQDLAVRELHALARYYDDGDERARELLAARVPGLDDDLIEECVDPTSIAASLDQWILRTDLKRRIAADSADIDAREQFQNIARLRDIAAFVDEQDFLANTWSNFITMLERAITYDAPYAHTAEVDVPEGGVTVGDVSLVKNDTRRAVFLVNVIDGEYPGTHGLSKLFPTAWLKQMDGYPAVTTPTADDVSETFTTATEPAGNAFERYHNHLSRRQLAVGARAAADQLYFCSYRTTAAGVGKPRHRSRYLHGIESHPDLSVEVVEGVGSDREIYTLGSASAEILSEPWTTLETVQATASQGETMDIQSAEETFAAIQQALETSDRADGRFVAAVDTQFDLARGAIRPETAPPKRAAVQEEPAEGATHEQPAEEAVQEEPAERGNGGTTDE